MHRAEFMRRLTELLGDVPPTERDEAIQYYNDYFDDAGAENESGVIASLGSPEELARSIKAGLNDGGNGGEFTESGFKGYTQVHKDEVMKTGDTAQHDKTSRDNNSYDGNTSYQDNTAYQGNSSYQNNASYQGNATYHGNTSYQGNAAYQGNTSYHGNGTQGAQQAAQPKQNMSGGMIVLIVIAAVLTSPVWLGLLGGLFGVVVGAVASLFGLFVAFLAVGVGMIAVSVALLVAGVAMMFTLPLGGLCMVGSAFILFAIGLVFIWLMVLTVGIAIPALVKGISVLGRRIFHRGGAQA